MRLIKSGVSRYMLNVCSTLKEFSFGLKLKTHLKKDLSNNLDLFLRMLAIKVQAGRSGYDIFVLCTTKQWNDTLLPKHFLPVNY